MAKMISDERKLELGYGTGSGADYKPWLRSGHFSSVGTSCSLPDWKQHRMVELMSQREVWYYYKIRWSDKVVDIREQFPLLPLDETTEIAKLLKIKPAQNGKFVMTTDMLIDMDDGSQIALSVKADRAGLTSRMKELAEIEEEYWLRRNVKFVMGFKEDLNPIEIINIKDCIAMYSGKYINDDVSLMRYLIARKVITVDMTKPLEYRALIEKYKETQEWIEAKSKSALC